MTPLLIVGASGRATAQVMARRGWSPTVIDFFADTDCPNAVKCESLDHAAAIAETMEPMPWMYTGGMENHPNVIERISRRHSLIGNDASTVRRVRDVRQLTEAIVSLGCRLPETSGVPHVGWLKKCNDSAGGTGVTLARSASEGVSPSLALRANGHEYWQRFIPGTPVSAAFENDDLLGTSVQLCGTPWLHASGFLYAGNIRSDSPHRDEWQRLGRGLHDRFCLRGHWGLDAIDDGERLWILELNPRFTASMELFEPDAPAAKGIYYAPVGHVFNVPSNPARWKRAPRDIPAAGTAIAEGEPVLTLFADSLLELQHAARTLDEELT